MDSFLQQRKASGESLMEARNEAISSLNDQMPGEKLLSDKQRREMKHRIDNYPLSVQDVRREKLTLAASFMEHTHDRCFDMCEQANDLTFLSIPEGKCFRNCITKIGYLLPAVHKSFQQGDEPGFAYQNELTE